MITYETEILRNGLEDLGHDIVDEAITQNLDGLYICECLHGKTGKVLSVKAKPFVVETNLVFIVDMFEHVDRFVIR